MTFATVKGRPDPSLFRGIKMTKDIIRKILFRFFAGIHCLLMLPYGVLVMYDKIFVGPFAFNNTFKVGIAALVGGIYMLIATFHGR